MTAPKRPDAPQAPVVCKRPEALRMHSRELFAGRQEIIIEHAGREYRLRVTQSGKLILTA